MLLYAAGWLYLRGFVQCADSAGCHAHLAAASIGIYQRDFLDVGLPEAPRPSFGVADIMPERGLLTS